MPGPKAYRDPNRVTTLTAISNDGQNTVVPLEADPATGRLLVNATGGGSGGTQYTTGTTTPSPAVGTLTVFDNGGTITGVSASNPLPVSASVTPPVSSTATVTKVVAANTATSLLSSNSGRKQYKVMNDLTSVTMYVLEGSGTVTSSNYTYIVLPGSYYETALDYTGVITGIWTAATGFAMVTELT